jgi:hypothetical protein
MSLPRAGVRPIARTLLALLLIGTSLSALGALAHAAGSAAAPRDAIDAAAQAGLVRLSIYFQENLNNGCAPRPGVVNCAGALSPDQNGGVLQAIRDALPPGFNTFDAFYVDSQGTRYGVIQVGGLYSVPFDQPGHPGAAGVQVRSTEGGTPGPFVTYTFAGLRSILHPPNAAWLGPSPTPMPQSPGGALHLAVPASADQLTIWPLVLFTDTIHVGSVTGLLGFSSSLYSPDMWAYLCYKRSCSGADLDSWVANGLEPSAGVEGRLENMADPARGQGALVQYTSLPVGWDGTNAASTGLWMSTTTGNVSQQTCLYLRQAGDQHKRVVIAIADHSNSLIGNNLAYHVTNFGVFEIIYPTSADRCGGSQALIQGRFLGYTWRNTEATATGDLGAAYSNGQVVLPFAPAGPSVPPTATATGTATDTPVATATAAPATATPLPTLTATDTPLATNTATPIATATATATATDTATATSEPPPATATSTPSLTALPATATATATSPPTPPPPTGTAPPATATAMPTESATPLPTGTATALPTGTAPPSPPTGTATRTPTALPPSHTPAPPPTTATATAPPPAATATVSATPCAAHFSDVLPTDYFATPVAYLACHGIISGYSDGTFRPSNPTTRGQMVKIVVGGFALAAPPVSPPGGYSFADVPPAPPFYRYIETAAALGIVSGYTCGGPGEGCDAYGRPYFRSGADVTRGQLSKIVVNAAGWPLQSPPTATFSDVPPGSPFYSYIETVACRGVVSGYADHTFRPAAGATRGQIAKIVYGALTRPPACAAPRG